MSPSHDLGRQPSRDAVGARARVQPENEGPVGLRLFGGAGDNVSRTGRCERAAPLRRGLRSGPGAPRAALWRAAAGKRVGHGRVDEGRCGADRRVPAGNHGAPGSKGLPP